MSQFLSQHLGQHLRMEQRLTPQLIQSMAVLQKSVADLETYVEEALERNAALEVAEPRHGDAPPDSVPTVDGDRAPLHHNDRLDQDGFARLDRMSRDYRDMGLDWMDRPPVHRYKSAGTGESDAKMGAMANAPGREEGLHEHLLSQWSLMDMPSSVRRAGEAIIDHIDPDGYLRVRFDEIAARTRPRLAPEQLAAALELVHKLEPRGIGARDIEECLLLQLDALPGDNRMERTLVRHHLGDLARNRVPAVAKDTGYSVEEINEALRAIRTSLCLHPGYLVGDRQEPPIRPDVIVDYADTGGGLEVRLARGNMPNLQIRKEVVDLTKSKSNGKATRTFARKQVEEATALIDAVRFRQSRLLEVAKAVAERQHDFFDMGPEGLRVCRMSDLAEALGCDPSTISRTVADKFVQTPRGIYPLRYFFTGGTETEGGECIGWGRVKTRVRDVINEEDRKSPLKDEDIARRLKSEGIDISRRTVAKYRQQLDIPAARQRQEH